MHTRVLDSVFGNYGFSLVMAGVPGYTLGLAQTDKCLRMCHRLVGVTGQRGRRLQENMASEERKNLLGKQHSLLFVRARR